MAKSIMVKPKRGRPPTGGRHPFVGIRLPDALLVQIAKWSESYNAGSRSEAIRRLVEFGLTLKAAGRKQALQTQADRAKELATHAIAKMADPAAPPEELAQRRRRLTKGPDEFRDARVDRAKK